MNRLLQRILACSFFLLTLLVSGKASLQATPVPNLLLDPTRPDTWAPEVKKVNDELRGLAQALISVAQDSDRPTKDRQKAILLLARIRNEEALAFLTSHVGIRLAPGAPKGAKEDVCQAPCLEALLSISSNDWMVAKAVLDSLDPPRTNRDLGDLASVLRKSLGVNLSLRVLHNQLLRCRNPERQKNLEYLEKVVPSD